MGIIIKTPIKPNAAQLAKLGNDVNLVEIEEVEGRSFADDLRAAADKLDNEAGEDSNV
ncbi:hypothetical protein [Xanthomonas phage XAJ2]|uniref:Uncharacterized protein n=1 Tax=Xanthomonas phage XAJ2 TaxID=1775249 RepID=A0A1I9L2K5_9CAUD|nr:hypothetical protein [Xanthomonas phage XAJ2]